MPLAMGKISITHKRPGCRRAWCDGARDVGAVYPQGNANIQSFNRSFREECLNVYWFEDLTDARAKMQVWKQEDNEERPHRSLKNLTPLQYKAQWHTQRQKIANPVA